MASRRVWFRAATAREQARRSVEISVPELLGVGQRALRCWKGARSEALQLRGGADSSLVPELRGLLEGDRADHELVHGADVHLPLSQGDRRRSEGSALRVEHLATPSQVGCWLAGVHRPPCGGKRGGFFRGRPRSVAVRRRILGT